MTPKRLPRPGEVQEDCRLCGAVLLLSVDNPRRVCAACGEINLPSDHASGGAAGPSVGSQLSELVNRPERALFAMAAVPTALVTPVLIQLFLMRLFARGSSLVLEVFLGLVALLAISGGPALALGRRRRMSLAPALTFWTAGLLAGGFVGPWLLIPLQHLMAWVMKLS